MAFSQYFTNKTKGAKLTSDNDFITCSVGDVLEKTTGERYQKSDANVFDKYEQSLISKEDALKDYASLASNNSFTGANTFNGNVSVMQANFENVSHGTTVHTQLSTPDLNVTHLGTIATLSCTDATVHGDLSSDSATSQSLNVTGTSNLANISSTGTTNLNVVRASGAVVVNNSVTANSMISNGAHTVGGSLIVSGSSTLSGAVTANATITANEKVIAKNGIIVGEIANPNVATASNGIGNIGDSTHYYNAVYATNFNGTMLQTSSADLAEKYLTDKEYPSGTVLQFCSDENASHELEEFNGGILAGVVSTKPGFLMNAVTKKGYQFIALQGRVPVLCDSDVKKGQYCVARSGKVYGVSKSGMNAKLRENIVGVALSNSHDDVVEVMVF